MVRSRKPPSQTWRTFRLAQDFLGLGAQEKLSRASPAACPQHNPILYFSMVGFRISQKLPSSIITSGLIPEKAANNACLGASSSAFAALSSAGQPAGSVMGLITGGLT
jgi:hypothetical protein